MITDTYTASLTLPHNAGHAATVTVTLKSTSDRHYWRWTVTNTDNGAQWTGTDLSTPAYGTTEPDPVDTLATLGGFLGAYAEGRAWTERTGLPSDNADLFPATLPPELAEELADYIDQATACPICHASRGFGHEQGCPLDQACTECGALPYEMCFPFCTAADSARGDA